MNYIGNGIYTYKEVSELTGLNVQTLRRWIEGYTRSDNNNLIKPVIQSDYSKFNSVQALSFMDLMEIIFISAFTKYKISLQSIRYAVERASKLLNTDHPFAMKKFYTDGKTILAKITKEPDSTDIVDLMKHQYQIVDIILPSLYECIDFNKFDLAEKWWPMGKPAGIVVDPNRNFGHPIIDELNIRVELIQELINSGHSPDVY